MPFLKKQHSSLQVRQEENRLREKPSRFRRQKPIQERVQPPPYVEGAKCPICLKRSEKLGRRGVDRKRKGSQDRLCHWCLTGIDMFSGIVEDIERAAEFQRKHIEAREAKNGDA